jgi:hypothetical protein
MDENNKYGYDGREGQHKSGTPFLKFPPMSISIIITLGIQTVLKCPLRRTDTPSHMSFS